MAMYESKAVVTTIKADSKVTIKIKDNFYSVNYSEERTIPNVPDIDVDKEREALWNDVNTIVDNQAAEILKTFR